MHRIALLPCLLFAATFWSCSGGGGGGDLGGGGGPAVPPVAPPVQLVFDTAAGSEARVTAQLDGVAFERVDGTAVGNLLDEPTPIVLADPEGRFSAVELGSLPTDVYQAVHVMFAPHSVRAYFPDGSDEEVVLTSNSVRISLAQPVSFPSFDKRTIFIANRGIDISRDGGDPPVLIDPDFGGAPSDVVPVRDVRITVMAIYPAYRRLTAELATDGSPTVDVVFDPNALLIRDDVRLGVDDFIAGLSVGSTIQVIDGEFSTDPQDGSLLTVFAASDLGVEDPHGNGQKAEVHGCIASIDAANETFALSLFTVDKGRHHLPDVLPGALTVDAGDANIKWVPREGRHTGHLPFAALEMGMTVEVEWHGPATDGSVPAQKVDIRDEAAAPLRSLQGDVTAIDSSSDELTVGLDTPIEVGGTSYASVRVRLTADTIVVGGDVLQLPIARFQVGDQVIALARQDTGDLFLADYVRVVD